MPDLDEQCWCGADWLPHLGPPEDCQLRHDPVMVNGELKEFYCGARRDQHHPDEHSAHSFVRRVCTDGHSDSLTTVPEPEGSATVGQTEEEN